MIVMKDLNYTTRVGNFIVDTLAELSKLPNLTSKGSDNLYSVNQIAVGSKAYVIADKKYYILNGSNTWVEYPTATGGGGGGIDPSDLATDEDIENIFS